MYVSIDSDDAIGALDFDKTWFVYLSEALQASTNDELCLEDYYIMYNKFLVNLMGWCHPHAYDIDVKKWPTGSNLLPFLPCGLVNAIKKHDDSAVLWTITVNNEFYVNVTFLRFEVRDSGKDCSSSALKIGAYDYARRGWDSKWYWSYCGYRLPWSETILSNKLIMAINQNNINYRFNVSFIYYIIAHDDYLGSELYYTDNIPARQQDLYYHIEHMHCIKWIVQLHIGYVAHFSTMKLSNFVGQVYIYDGPTQKYSMFSLRQFMRNTFVTDINTTSAYFTTVVKLMPHRSNKDFNRHQVMELSFEKKWRYTGALLSLYSRTPIQSRGNILHAVYSVSGVSGHYPNITFDIRKFDGWNEGGCNMGGYILVQQLFNEDKALFTSGPYCPGGGSNQPLITENGPEFIVLNRKETLLVIYAFGPEYWIDLDVIVSVSLCEGSFDFPLLCQAELDISQTIHSTMNWDHFQLNCNRLNRLNNTYIAMRMLKFSGCLIAQVVIYQKLILYQLEVLNRMHVTVDYRSPVHRNIDGGVIQFSHIYLLFGSTKTRKQSALILTSSKILDLGEVTTLTYRQHFHVPYHESVVTITMLQGENNYDSEEKCQQINQSVVQHKIHRLYEDVEAMKLSSLCATGYYQKAKTYIYTIIPRYMTHLATLSNTYVNIQELKCGDMMNVSSSLTIALRTAFSQSFHITNNETIEIEVPNVSILMAVEKHDTCSTMIFQYRVHILAVHDGFMKDMLDNNFQVDHINF